MRSRKIFIVAILVFAVAAWAKVFPPTGKHKPLYFEISGKKYRYWKCDKKLSFEIDGVREGKIYIRTIAGTKPKVKIYLDGDKIKEIKIDEKKSKKARHSKYNNITKAYVMQIKIPDGKHKLTIKSSDLIFVRINAKKKIKYYSYVPQKHAGGMVLVSRETEYGYYKSKKSHPVMFEIIGKGTVKVMTRLLYDKTMKGRQHYSVAVRIDDGKPITYSFETEPSSVSYFSNNKDIIPGKGREITIKIPEGHHYVYVYPTNSREIAMRVLVPEYMVKIKK